jgi:hypothetical protein
MCSLSFEFEAARRNVLELEQAKKLVQDLGYFMQN